MILQHVDTLIHEIAISPLLQHAGSGFGETVKDVTRSIFKSEDGTPRKALQVATDVGKQYLTHIGKGATELALGVSQMSGSKSAKNLDGLRDFVTWTAKKVIPKSKHVSVDSFNEKIDEKISNVKQNGANNIAKGLGRAAAIYAPVYAIDKTIDHQVHEYKLRKQYRELHEMFKKEHDSAVNRITQQHEKDNKNLDDVLQKPQSKIDQDAKRLNIPGTTSEKIVRNVGRVTPFGLDAAALYPRSNN